jgi:hypothetical protein
MKKKAIKIIMLLFAVLICTIVYAVKETELVQKDFIDSILKPELQKQCGLQKLTSKERQSLCSIFQSLMSADQISDSAKVYLENEGWEEVRVLETRWIKEDEDSEAQKYLVVEKRAWTYILEPRTSTNLTPGRYLGKMGSTSCEIIDYNGDVVEFLTKDFQG